MPLYAMKCEDDHSFDRLIKLANFDNPHFCECGKRAHVQIVPTMIAPMFEDYQSPIDGSAISSKRKRMNDLARSNCVPYDPGMVEENNRRLKTQEASLEKSIDNTVDAFIEKLPARKKEILAQELAAGASINYHRG